MRLGQALKAWRENMKMTLRTAAQELGINHSTLCRIEAGKNMDGNTLATILRWLLAEAE